MIKVKKYFKNEDGNFAIMFGVTAALIAAGVAVAIDVAGMTNAHQKLQNGIDSAALSAVIDVATNGSNINANENSEAYKRQYEDAVLAALSAQNIDLKGTTPELLLDSTSLTVEANIPYTFQFGGLINKKSSNIGVFSKVALPGNGAAVEIALVLDNTESMNYYGKMGALREGARDFIEAIDESNSGSKIALVPFARYVDVGVDKRNEPWLDVPAEFDTNRTWQQATHTGGTCTEVTETRYNDGVQESYQTTQCTGQTTTYEEMSRVEESRWIGCVGVRSNDLHLEDDEYDTADKKIPGLLHKIGHLYGTDRTYIPMGLIWGQRILSPQAPFTEADTVNPKRQIMILMSDGNNTAYLEDVDDHESIPYVQDLSSQEQQDGVIPPGTNEDTAALCTSIKAEGIEMFTIAFRVENTTTENLLMNCASSPQHYFDAESNNSLVATFQEISESLESEIRIMR